MDILNLTDVEKSQIKFKISQFPDGQQSVTITSESVSEELQIRSRLNSFRDLELIICATQALRELGVKTIHLYVPYFLGARSDRKFSKGSSNYLKTVICPVINSQNFASVSVIDPHSDVLEACLNNFRKINNLALAKFAIDQIGLENTVIISPDAGALKKVYDVAEAVGCNDIIIASKHRDIKSGQITHTDVPVNMTHANKKFVIFDDICDGGRTFTEIAKVVKEKFPEAKIYLVITHGIFSAGLRPLNQAFAGIFCTNSFIDMNNNEFSMRNDNELHKLKQLNVF